MKTAPRAFLSVILGLCLAFAVRAQHHHFHHFNIKEVLASAFVYKSYEDKKGYIWFLTDKGIIRFDGHKSWNLGPADGYMEGGAYQVLEDNQGSIWFITKNFKAYVYRNDRLHAVPSSDQLVWLDIGRNGKLYALSRLGKIFCINADLSLTTLRSKEEYLGYSFASVDDSTFVVGSHQGVRLVNGENSRFMLDGDTYKTFVIPRVFRTSGKKTYVSGEKGLYEVRNKQLHLVFPLKGLEIYELQEDAANRCLWLATTSGLMRVSPGNRMQTTHLFPLPTLSVTLMRDRSIWTSTTNKGVFFFHPEAIHFTSGTELAEENIRFVAAESNKIYLFNRNNFFYRIGNKGLQKIPLGFKTDQDPIRELSLVRTVSDTQLYVMSQLVVAIEKGKPRTLSWEIGRTTVNLFGDRDVILSCEEGYALNKCENIRVTRQQITRLQVELSRQHLSLERPFPYFIDGDTSYFAFSSGVIKVYWRQNKPFYRLFRIKGVVTQMVVAHGRLFVATETNGVYMINGKQTVNYSTDNYLLSNYCNRVRVRWPFLWAVTSNGLFRTNLNTGAVTNFTELDYLVNNEVNDLEFLHDSVYVACAGGLSIFPEHAGASDAAPRVYLERIKVNNRDTAVSDQFTFDYVDNNISLVFCSPGYRSSSRNKFRLIITGNNRVDTTYYREGNVQLFALSPGTYRLEADVMNIDGVWSKRPVKLSITINPPFWKTWWFISIIALVLMGVVAYIVWISVRRQKEIQEYTRKIAESELKSLRLYMNPHFLFNSLTSLQSFILTQKTGEANSFITKFSRLIRSVMTYSIRGELKLSDEIELLRAYLELESVRFSTEFEYSIVCDPEIDCDSMIIPSLIIQPFIENAIKHGVTGVSGRRCYIHVHFFMENNNLYCTIADNGKGRKRKKAEDKIHISSGIKFTEERIRLLINDQDKPVIMITDTTNDPMMPGTTVKVLVPVLNLDDL